MKKEKFKNNKGITLIALIITIIVMLVLVGVTVTTAINGNLFDKTKYASKETKIKAYMEELQGAVVASYDVATNKIDKTELSNNLGAEWTVKGEDTFRCINAKEEKIAFIVTQEGEITYIERVKALEDDNDPLTIGAIEDLVDLSIAVNGGTTYEGETITLLISLDFNDEDSYRTSNPETTPYTDKISGNEVDINGNGTVEPIMTELTTGLGFMPIGLADMEGETEGIIFKGNFEGNEKTLNNLYINRPEGIASLFGGISAKTNIQNLTLKEPRICGMVSTGMAVSMDITGSTEDTITIQNCHTKGGKIGAVNQNCISMFSAGLIYAFSMGEINVIDSSNESIISGMGSCGLAHLMSATEVNANNCSNYGKIIIEDSEYYNSLIEEEGMDTSTVGCVIAAAPAGTVTNCSNYADLSEKSGELVGVVSGSGISVTDCINRGRLIAKDASQIYVLGVFEDGGYDIAGNEESRISELENQGEIEVSGNLKNWIYVSGIGLGNDIHSTSSCINKGNINVEGTFTYNTSSVDVGVAGVNIGNNEVYDCINYGNINVNIDGWSPMGVGGIGCFPGKLSDAGTPVESLFSNCINYGNITTKGDASGICCYANKAINCANYGDITGTADSAGITTYANAEVFNCYNIGKITGMRTVQGIAVSGTIKNCYNLGAIIKEYNSVFGPGKQDPISTEGTKTNCYALTGTETAEEKQTLLNSLNTNREDTTTWSEWKIDSRLNNGYPVFSFENVE